MGKRSYFAEGYSEDTDLICLVLIHLERSITDKNAFYKLVHKYPEALNLLKVYYRHKVEDENAPLLHDLMMGKNFFEAANQLSPDCIPKLNTNPSK